MNNMRKLMEAVQLNEYIVREGGDFKSLLALNVFEDLIGSTPVKDTFGGREKREWLEVAKEYMDDVRELARGINKVSKQGRKLTAAEAAAAENTWYDGSDAYADLESALEWLPEVYDQQIEVLVDILEGQISDDDDGDYAPFGEEITEGYGIENDEVEQHIEEAAKALAKDAVLQAVGVWNEEGDGEGRFRTDAKNAKEYVSIAAPRFLDDEYKGSIMEQFEEYFHQYVSYFTKYLNKNESVEEEIVQVDPPEFDDADDSMEYFSEYQISDWKAVSPEFFEDLAAELENHGLKLYLSDTGGDDYAWRIDK